MRAPSPYSTRRSTRSTQKRAVSRSPAPTRPRCSPSRSARESRTPRPTAGVRPSPIPSPRTTRSRSRLRASRPPWARCCSTRAATTSSRSSWTRTGTKTRRDDRTVVKEYTREDIEEMAEFHNGSSQCGMTGFRTFSGMGVPVRTLLEQAGVTVGTTDAFEIDVTDHYGVNTHNYSSLLGGDRDLFQKYLRRPGGQGHLRPARAVRRPSRGYRRLPAQDPGREGARGWFDRRAHDRGQLRRDDAIWRRGGRRGVAHRG